MAYTRNIPTSGQFQSVSQPIIRDNFNSCDDTFNLDHYGFSDTSHPGNHKIITSIDQMSIPLTPTSPQLFATSQAGTNLGVLQYSKGPDRIDQGPQVVSPVTFIQSSTTAITINNLATIDIFDFTGITRAFARLIVGNFSAGSANRYINSADMLWTSNGPGFSIIILNSNTNNLAIASNGTNILQVRNLTGSPRNNVYWTLQFLRIEI